MNDSPTNNGGNQTNNEWLKKKPKKSVLIQFRKSIFSTTTLNTIPQTIMQNEKKRIGSQNLDLEGEEPTIGLIFHNF